MVSITLIGTERDSRVGVSHGHFPRPFGRGCVCHPSAPTRGGGKVKTVVLAEAKQRHCIGCGVDLGGITSLMTSRPPDFTRRRKRTNSGLAPVGVRYCNTACGTMRSSECSGSRAISCGATTRIFGLSANRCSSSARKPGAASHNWSSPAAASAISACSALNRSRARALAVGHDRRDLLGDQPVVHLVARIDVDRMRSVPESKPVGVVRSATARSADPSQSKHRIDFAPRCALPVSPCFTT